MDTAGLRSKARQPGDERVRCSGSRSPLWLAGVGAEVLGELMSQLAGIKQDPLLPSRALFPLQCK